jgi:hypothetical protein
MAGFSREFVMVTLSEQEQQVLDIIGTLPAERRRLVLYELAKDSQQAWRRNTTYAEEQLRKLAADCGQTWDGMSDQQRQAFVDDLLHEDG